ncbi:MAG: hypothetical protein ACJ8BW_21340 [Ktedonobacteraceae bacterium]
MKRYFASIKQYSWILLACTVIAAGAGFILSKSQPVTFQVSSLMYVNVGAPGTTFTANGTSTASAADSLTTASNYSTEILTRSVMDYVYQTHPEIGRHGYTANDLLADILPVSSTTSPTITITATASTPAEGVILANAVANGFESYVTKQFQDHLNILRQNIQSQLTVYQKQNSDLANQIQRLNNPQDPRTQLWTADRNDVIHNIDTLNSQLQALPTSIHSDVYVIQDAQNSDAQPTAKASTIIAATAGVGLLLGAAIMLLLIFLDSRLRSEEQVKAKLGMAYLGSLSNEKDLENSPTKISGVAAREVADICANLRLTGVLPGQWQTPHGGVLLITSPQSAEGKTTLAAALAMTFARSGGMAVVIDGNLRQPSTHLTFGVNPASSIGLSGVLKSNGQSVDDAVLRSNIPGIWLLPAGAPMNDSAFLVGQKMPAVLTQLRQKIDLIIIDGPPLLIGADASLLATMADGVALIVDVRHEKLARLLRVKELLKSLTHTPAGVVMNRFTRSSSKGDSYYAVAFPVDSSDGWRSVKALENNGNRFENNGNGHKVEQIAPYLVSVPSSPVPQSAQVSGAPPAGMPSNSGLQKPWGAPSEVPAFKNDPTAFPSMLTPPHSLPQRADIAPTPSLLSGKDR